MLCLVQTSFDQYGLSVTRNYLYLIQEIWYFNLFNQLVVTDYFYINFMTILGLNYEKYVLPKFNDNELPLNLCALWNQNVHYHVHNCSQIIPLLNNTTSLHDIPSLPLRFTEMLSSHLCLNHPIDDFLQVLPSNHIRTHSHLHKCLIT